MVGIHPNPVQLVLVLHTAVDYLYRQGAGIGVVQQAECAMTGIIKNQLNLGLERKYCITRENLVAENVKTAGRAQMLALAHALGLAHGTIKRGYPKAVQLQKVMVFCDSPKVVQTINFHIKYGPNSLRDMASSNDRSIIKKVIGGVRRLSRRGLEVTIALSSGKDKAGQKAWTIARQKGRKACRSRRQLRPKHNDWVKEQEEAAGDQQTFELVIRAKEPPQGQGA